MTRDTTPLLSPPRARRTRIAVWLAPPLVTALVVWLGLGGSSRDFRVPMSYSGDALFYLVHTRTTLDYGWWWWNPAIGVPLVYPSLIFPQDTNVDHLIVWLFRWFTRDASLAVNLLWISMVTLSASTSAWGLRRLGSSSLGAGVAGVVFALSPYAMYRGVIHLNLSIYLVPFAATAAVLLASGRRDLDWRWQGFGLLVAGNVLIGLDYIYNAFFACVLLAAGLAIGLARQRSRALVDAGALLLGGVIVATILNLIPNEVAWRAYGHPRGVTHSASESEGYGLKIRHLVSPTLNHWFGPFATWQRTEERADFPIENENTYTRLGIVSTIGFLGLLFAFVNPRRAKTDAEIDVDNTGAAARLTAVALLVAVVGGFGSLFSLLVVADIRAYSRIAPFIAFFALTGLTLWIDRLTSARPKLRAVIWCTVLIVGVCDQYPALRDAAIDGAAIEPEFHKMGAFVSSMEQRLPAQAMVFQLPLRPYPLDGGVESMGVYDHFRPYISSHQLRWSYPALSIEQYAWEQKLANLPPAELLQRLSDAGFAAILINRWGYKDQGESLARDLRDAPAGATPLVQNDDFIALALRPR